MKDFISVIYHLLIYHGVYSHCYRDVGIKAICTIFMQMNCIYYM